MTNKDCLQPCDDPCEGKVPTKQPLYIPAFHSTYVNNFQTHYPNNYLHFEPPCGGPCSCGPRCKMLCNGISQEQRKKDVLQHGPNYIGTSKNAMDRDLYFMARLLYAMYVMEKNACIVKNAVLVACLMICVRNVMVLDN